MTFNPPFPPLSPTVDVAPACAEGGPCISPSARNKTLQSEDLTNGSLTQTASLEGSYNDEKRPLIKRTPPAP